ncbi:MAG: hypothetical protein ACRD5K_17295 [Candidatus Acidiferrales bacterium]
MAQQLSKHFGRFIVVALASALWVSVTPAQTWLNFARPSPTATEWSAMAKLPDFTGVWEEPLGSTHLVVSPEEAKQGEAKTAARSKFPASSVQPTLPLTPAWAAKAKYLEAHAAQDNAQANCLPYGMPTIMTMPYPYEFLLTPGQVTIIGEEERMIRHIYTDGRPLPKDPDPTFWGTSVGHWEGNTLVVETVGFSPQTLMVSTPPVTGHDVVAVPHSSNMKIIERFRLLDPNTMQIKTTIIDPVALTRPYTTTRIMNRYPNWTIDEYICQQNNRNSVTSSGKAEVDTIPPPPSELNSK